MKLGVSEDNNWYIDNLNIIHALMLCKLPETAYNVNNEEINLRFFKSPIDTDNLNNIEEIEQDWHDYIYPEMLNTFLNQINIVKKDLKDLIKKIGYDVKDFNENNTDFFHEEILVKDKNIYVSFPIIHSEEWLSTLNQARICLYEIYKFEDEDDDEDDDEEDETINFDEIEDTPEDPNPNISELTQQIAYLQWNFYGIIQSFLIDNVFEE